MNDSFFRWNVIPDSINDTNGDTAYIGLCETIIKESGNSRGDKDFGNNYASVQISAQFVTSNQLRIFASAPFWGKVHYLASST